jgi:hypothetical protein
MHSKVVLQRITTNKLRIREAGRNAGLRSFSERRDPRKVDAGFRKRITLS